VRRFILALSLRGKSSRYKNLAKRKSPVAECMEIQSTTVAARSGKISALSKKDKIFLVRCRCYGYRKTKRGFSMTNDIETIGEWMGEKTFAMSVLRMCG
jgi:hypothetical protein